MNRILIFLILTIAFFSCEKEKEENRIGKPLKNVPGTVKEEKTELNFNDPDHIDSSVYVMYPLSLKNEEESDSYSSSGGSPMTYWNIIFYNTENSTYHLLSDSLKMLIYSYNFRNDNSGLSSSSSGSSDNVFESGYNQVDRLIYYSIITNDFNEDGKLNSNDPNYLYISDKEGLNFKQISPDNSDVTGWQTIKGTNKILIMATKDSNGDKKFDHTDEWIPIVYDITKNSTSMEIFNDAYKSTLKKLMNTSWPKED